MTCTATGDDYTKLQWQIDGRDATNLSDGQTYEILLATSVLKFNLSTESSCKWIEGLKQKCFNNIACLATRSGSVWDSRSYLHERIIGVKP